MTARQPEDVLRLFSEAFAARDLEGLVGLYEPEAVLVPQPGVVATGHQAIREALGGLLAIKGPLRTEIRSTFRTGDLALVISEWSLVGTAPDGSAVELGGKASDVLRRQPDGTWRVAIDNPFGTA